MKMDNKWTLASAIFVAGSLAVQALPPGAGPMEQEGPSAGRGTFAQKGPQPGAGSWRQRGPLPETGRMRGVQGIQRPGRLGPHQGFPPVQILEKLGVSKDQIEALEDLQYTRQKAEIDLRAAAEQAELELQHALKEGDEAAAMKAVDKVTKARGELLKQEISTRLKVKEILGEETLRKLEEQRPRGQRLGPAPGDGPIIPGPGPDDGPEE